MSENNGKRQNAQAPIAKVLTPEQIERRRIVNERTRRMSERGVPQPTRTEKGIFGGRLKGA